MHFSDFALAQISVEVAVQYSAIESPLPATSKEEYQIYRIKSNVFKDKFHLVVPDGLIVNLSIVDERSINDPKFDTKIIKKKLSGPITFILPENPHGSALIVDVIPKKDSRIPILYRIGSRTGPTRDQVKNYLSELPILISKVYYVPEFKIVMKPCGKRNAFSNPDITICTELFAYLDDKGIFVALQAVEAHEIAHSLLELWGLPGFDNEDTADEFSAFILGKYSPKSIEAYIKFMESNDSVSEAINLLTHGARHTISIQRARNMKANLKNLPELSRRWGKLLLPFQKNKLVYKN